MRGWVVLVCLLTTQVGAEERRGPARWQQSTSAPALSRVWGVGAELYGVGASGAHRSTDGGATWSQVGDPGAAIGVWGSALDDVWVVRARTLHHSTDGEGEHWTTRTLPVSFGTTLEGMWGVDRDRYVFGADRSDGRGVILHSRDGGTSWQRESVEIERVAGMWGIAGEIYAVGARGAILKSAGDGRWQTIRTSTGSLEGIWGTSRAIYAVGTGGTILFSSDGKTWTPRTSGVKYTLTSIAGLSARELFVGSVDGAPLRSTDGTTWKPITALIPRGHVWASASNAIVASSDVHFLGESAPVEPDLPRTAGPDLAEINGWLAQFRGYPYATALMQLAGHRFDSRRWIPSWLASAGTPKIRMASIKDCSKTADQPATAAPTHPGTEIVVDLRCERSCAATPMPTVAMHGRLVVAGAEETAIKVTLEARPTLCEGVGADRIPLDALIQSHTTLLAATLGSRLAQATTDSARIDAYASYVLDGGYEQQPRLMLAKLLGKDPTWRGFFWSSPVATAPTPSPVPRKVKLCDPIHVAQLAQQGDDAMRNGSFQIALDRFQAARSCLGSDVTQKAYLAACRARRFPEARSLFVELGKVSLAQICIKEGFDPRKP